MISIDDYLMNRGPVSDELMENAEDLLEKVALLEEMLNDESPTTLVTFVLTGGYRPEAMIENHTLPGCPHDAHTSCRGIDLHDPDLAISKRLTEDPTLLEDANLWMESIQSAKNHLHIQSVSPRSGKRIFIA